MSARHQSGGPTHGSAMNLEELQRQVFEVVRRPLTEDERMCPTMPDGRSSHEIAEAIIKPNDRLTSVERLEIYNRVYWFRILSSLADDYPGLRAVVGQKKFDRLILAYLTELPSESFSLRNLGARMESWLRQHPEFTPKHERLALDMVRLEWADIDVFDAADLPALKPDDLAALGDDPRFHLQPYLRLLDFEYPVDDLLLSVRDSGEEHADIVSNVAMIREPRKRRRRAALPRARRIYLAVHRQDYTVYFKRLEPEAFALLRALREGRTLGEAIEISVNWSNQPLEHVTGQLQNWFANWSALGWFCRNIEN
jgi:hypothetical protein